MNPALNKNATVSPVAFCKITMTNVAHELIARLESLSRSSAVGLMSLLCLAIREQTDLADQMDEWGFTDIPQDLILELNELDDIGYLEVCGQIATIQLENKANDNN
jgi:hypothetical protein